MICLPSAHGLENDLGHLQPEADDVQDFDSAFANLLQRLGWSEAPRDATYSIESAKRLGIDAEGWSKRVKVNPSSPTF